MMLRKGLICLSASYIAACASAVAADAPLSPAAAVACPPAIVRHASGAHRLVWRHKYVWRSEHSAAARRDVIDHSGGDHRDAAVLRAMGGGLAWGLAPGAGQLGAAGLGYYHAESCLSYESVYDRWGNYVREQPTNICITPPAE
ncbi:hypothetical protein [Methylocapsa sp. S129]|uniref:hypothetical protein n=1 Tax=Methylocapsa sp. S129 TaxID=1641869 RepID=UPI00131EA9C8|nr:hypothetical protein [Methylocapsa sp. S129]